MSGRGGEPEHRELSAPAKINLGLRVVGRRTDGYHEIESLFLPLDLADRLRVEIRPAAAGSVSFRLEVDPETSAGEGAAPADASNLAAKAASAFLAEAGLADEVQIRLRKQIPVGAGLGGGSSDAAAVLRGLDALRPGALSQGALASLALRLGADVPYFLDPRPAWVRGIGERIEPVAGLPGLALLLANPGVSVATAEVYAAYDALGAALTPAGATSTMRPLSRLLALGGTAEDGPGGRAALEELLVNDLEPAALRLCPPIGRLRAGLRKAGAPVVGMSGSGATVYGIFRDPAEAQAAQPRLLSSEAPQERPRWARVARTLGSEEDPRGLGASPNW